MQVQSIIPQRIEGLFRKMARKLSRQFDLDFEEVWQDCQIAYWKRSGKYNPAKSKESTFWCIVLPRLLYPKYKKERDKHYKDIHTDFDVSVTSNPLAQSWLASITNDPEFIDAMSMPKAGKFRSAYLRQIHILRAKYDQEDVVDTLATGCRRCTRKTVIMDKHEAIP